MNKYNIVFESENIYFVKLTESLLNDYLIMVNNPEIANKIMTEVKMFTIEEEKEWINNKLSTNANCYSMIEKSTQEFIGNIEIVDFENDIAKLGIAITKLKQNKHYGKESLLRFIDYCYNNLNIKNFSLNVFNDNYRAIKCYKNIGFIESGIGKNPKDIYMTLNKEKGSEKI